MLYRSNQLLGYTEAVVEKVHGYKNQSASSAFNFGYAAAQPMVVCKVLDIPVTTITPVSWKKKVGLLTTDKDASRQLALKLYPELQETLKFKKNVDRADAILIALSQTL